MTVETAVYLRQKKQADEAVGRETAIKLMVAIMRQSFRFSTYGDEYLAGIASEAIDAERQGGRWRGMDKAHDFVKL